MVEGPAPDDPTILSGELVYRRVPGRPSLLVRDEVTGKERPSTGAFQEDADGISVYRHARLVELGQGPEAVQGAPTDVVFGVEVGDVRALHLGVVDDPWPEGVPDPGHPRHGAHALITGKPGMTRAQWKRARDGLVRARSLQRVVG